MLGSSHRRALGDGWGSQGRKKGTEMLEAPRGISRGPEADFATKEKTDYPTSVFLKPQASKLYITLKHTSFKLHFSNSFPSLEARLVVNHASHSNPLFNTYLQDHISPGSISSRKSMLSGLKMVTNH